MGFIKTGYGGLFRTALVDAIAALSAPQRELQRLHFDSEELTMEQLAALLALHRATAARRVQAAAHATSATTRRLLKDA